MPKDYSKLLLDLKPLLPSGYQTKILESLADARPWHIKHAFTGRVIQIELLKKIYKKAAALARKEQKQLARANSEVRELKKAGRQMH